MNCQNKRAGRAKLPPWIRIKVSGSGDRERLDSVLKRLSLNTVCQSAKCPNLSECWHKQKATFMILGEICTRNCRFCAVGHDTSPPSPPSPCEITGVAEAVAELGLGYVVITSVTRDDLPDGGASHFASVIREIRRMRPETKIEVLVPDFKGDRNSILKVTEASPTVFNHNLETVERLTPLIRSGADFRRSLSVLETVYNVSDGKIPVKSGIMVGLGETDDEIETTICEIRSAGAEILTIGQYLPPIENSWRLDRYLSPEKFEYFRLFALEKGFRSVASAPLVRSSYHADESYGAGSFS